MNIQHKYIFVCALIFLFFPIIYSTITTDKITATDWTYRHSVWIDAYLHGDFSPITIYQPLFHWLMSPFVYINFPMKYFQIIFAMLTSFGILYYTYKNEKREALLFMSVFLASSIAFVQFSSSLMPQALDYFIFPIILISYFNNKNFHVFLAFMILAFMHSSSIIFLSVLILHSLLTKRYKATYMLFILFIIVFPITFYYVFSAKNLPAWQNIFQNWDYESQLKWETQYTTPFYNFFIFSGFMAWLLLPIALYRLWKQKSLYNDKLLLYAIWFFAFLSLIFFNFGVYRFITYAIIPLSLFVASILSRSDNNEKNNV